MSELDKARRPAVYAAALAAFNEVPESTRYNLNEALTWALETLEFKEGTGHSFEISFDEKSKGFVASFCKPQWKADHSSQPMNTAQEAIVMAVCEYLNGV
jgi:hypothetical protein